ncbi:PEP-CTERM sorting domain-containing protein [Ancylothrix sp. C2]|uniref:PEP-CTERM sorting domain-containing protein n=1 Tax=Ancylothrix sp. D3o TaxID=2953691 RepID=UPI0021BABDA2|nr:PEP-CTERM sorting domain-containing protein [Ancylothrix sp. D3o]MCT7951165.1 PEP-CTERM sorting domain-containing protein [Ancylothrix sp. D3o]
MLKTKLLLLMFAVGAINVCLLSGVPSAIAQNASSSSGWTLDCSTGTCTRTYMGANFATTSAHKSIPEPSLVLGIMTVGGVMLACKKKRISSRSGNKKLS